jgi:hypothetical protein
MLLRDRHGAAAWEFVLIFFPFFLVVFSIFDLGRLAITEYSLHTLASAGARAVMINCYPQNINAAPPAPATCAGDPLTDAAKRAVAPFLYFGSLTPSLNVPAPVPGATALTVTATQPNFAMIMPIWGNIGRSPPPSASTTIPLW